MSISSKISELNSKWDQQGSNIIKYKKPNILLAHYMEKYYITIDDSKSVFFFISSLGQVYACIKEKCIPVKIEQGQSTIYNIPELGALQIISCQPDTVFSPLSDYANKNLRNIIFR